MSAWAHLIHCGLLSSQDQTSLFAVRTLDFPSPCNLCMLLKHYCLPPWKQQLLDCLPVYLSPVLLPCWAGETDAFIMSVFCRQGSLPPMATNLAGLQGQSGWGKPPGPFPSWLPKWCRQTVCKATPELWGQAPAPSTWPLLLCFSQDSVCEMTC